MPPMATSRIGSRVSSGLSRIHWPRVGVRAALAAIPLAFLLPTALGFHFSETVDRLENYLYDVRIRLTMPGGVDPRIVIVDIDEKSLAVEGHWPWTRAKLATLLDQLFDVYGARVVAFDAIFPEAEEASALALVEELRPLAARNPALMARLDTAANRYEADRRFSESLIARDVVLGIAFRSTFTQDELAEAGALPAPLNVVGEQLNAVPWIKANGYIGNLPELQTNAAAGGFIDTSLVDADGVIRRMPLMQSYKGKLYPSLALSTAGLAMARPPIRLGFEGQSGKSQRLAFVAVGDSHIPVDASGSMLIPFRGPVNSFPYVSATRVLRNQASPAILKDAIVLVGTTAAGSNDVRPTPVGRQYIGVEAHANAVAGILDQTVLGRPSWATAFEAGTLIAFALFTAFVLPSLAPSAALISVAALGALLVAFNFVAWTRSGLVLPVATPLVYLVCAAALVLNYSYFIESRRKRRLSRVFSQYVPPEIVRELDASDADVSLEGESRDMSVLFSDVRGFTTLSEGFSPRELTKLMNELLTPLTEVIQQQRGTIDKYMGDAIMAFWGAPLADDQHASRAVGAALRMVECTRKLREDFIARGWPPVYVGVGVNSGIMNVGNMGSRFRMAYTVLGDAVNLGSRLEGLTKQYGVEIIVSGATAKLCPDIVFRELDLVRVKGKNEPVAILEPMGLRAELASDHASRLEQFGEMLKLYRSSNFPGADGLLAALAAERDEPLITLYRQRIAHFLAEPPPNSWDGVFVHQTK